MANQAPPPTIVNVGYRSTNFWIISAGRSRLMVDLGWPGSMRQMEANLRRRGIPLEEIRYGLATHFHIDHAGLAQDFKLAGVTLLVINFQLPHLPLMKQWTKPHDHYTEITLDGNRIISCDQSRDLLAGLGIAGEIVHTPGHSDHCVSLLLDDGSVFTGDLPPPELAGMGDPDQVAASWQLLRDKGATRIHPGHGPIRSMPG